MGSCGPERVEVAPGVTRPVAHGQGNLKVCSESGEGTVGRYFDPYAFNYNLQSALEGKTGADIAGQYANVAQGLAKNTGTAATAGNAISSTLQAALLGNTQPLSALVGGSPVASASDFSLFQGVLPYIYQGGPTGFGGTLGYGSNSGLSFEENPVYGPPAPDQSGGGFSFPGGLQGILTGAALAGGLGLLFGGDEQKATQTTSLPPPTAAELQLLGINTQLATQQLQAFQQQLQQQGFQNNLVNRVFQGELGVALDPAKVQQAKSACEERFGVGTAAANHCLESLKSQATQDIINQRNFERQQAEQERVQRSNALSGQQDQLGQLALGDAQQGTQPLRPDQLANLTGAADLAIQSGLSDIERFRDETLDKVRQNSATRGLRPGDTPITNQFHDVGTEATRLAQNYVNNIRGQQLNAQLTLPFQEAELRGQRLGLASDLALRRQQLEDSLAESARNSRLGLTSGVLGAGLGLATGLNPASAFGALTAARTAGASTTTSSSGGNLAQTLGGIGGLLTGLGNTGLFGKQNQNQGLFY